MEYQITCLKLPWDWHKYNEYEALSNMKKNKVKKSKEQICELIRTRNEGVGLGPSMIGKFPFYIRSRQS